MQRKRNQPSVKLADFGDDLEADQKEFRVSQMDPDEAFPKYMDQEKL